MIEVRDVETEEIVPLYIRLGLKEDLELPMKTPHVLPPFENITSIRIDDSHYYSVNLDDFPFTDEKVRPIIWVKRRSDFEKREVCNIESLRTINKMKENKLLSDNLERDEKTDILMTKHELEWDKSTDQIIMFFRSSSLLERTKILKENPCIKEFLRFYGITPSSTLKDACFFDDNALAFLLPHLSTEEINHIINS